MLCRCEREGCGSTNIEATFLCQPCANDPQGWTEWKANPVKDFYDHNDPQHPDPDGVPARQRCPGCGTDREAIHVICNECWHSWVPVYPH